MKRPRLDSLFGIVLGSIGIGAYGAPCGSCPSSYEDTLPVLFHGDGSGAAADAGDAGSDATATPAWTADDDPPRAECTQYCGSNVVSCRKILAGDAGAVVPAVVCKRPESCGAGRRPAGFEASTDSHGDAAERWVANVALLEAVSVEAFRRLRGELHLRGAPRAMLRRASRAKRDERRHARATAAFARRLGARVDRAIVAPAIPRDLEAFALENAVEGCVGETWGALVATLQAHRATDPQLRATMVRIAREERRHAELAYDVHAFASARLDARARARVDTAMREAAMQCIRTGVADSPALRSLGLPTYAEAATLARALFTSLGVLAV